MHGVQSFWSLKTSSKEHHWIRFCGANICKLMQIASQGTSLTLNLFPCKVMTSTSTTSFCSLPLSEASPMAHGPGVGTVAIDWKFAYWQVNLQRINVKRKILLFCLDLFSGNHIDFLCRTSVERGHGVVMAMKNPTWMIQLLVVFHLAYLHPEMWGLHQLHQAFYWPFEWYHEILIYTPFTKSAKQF